MKIQSIVKSLLSAFALVFIFIPNVSADGHAYTIDSSNVSQYADMLSEGEKKMLVNMKMDYLHYSCRKIMLLQG